MRLRSIRMKDGGAKIHVLHTPMPHDMDGTPENWRGRIISASKAIADMDEPGSTLDGYLVIGLFSNGTTSMGVRLPERLPRSLAPAYIAEILRRDIVTERECEQVFDNKFEWVE